MSHVSRGRERGTIHEHTSWSSELPTLDQGDFKICQVRATSTGISGWGNQPAVALTGMGEGTG